MGNSICFRQRGNAADHKMLTRSSVNCHKFATSGVTLLACCNLTRVNDTGFVFCLYVVLFLTG